ncbi:MAG: inositol monophosphatase family protein [Pirellulales bacterium]
MDASLQHRLERAIQVAREGGKSTLSRFQKVDLAVERKADDSPVTAADRDAERLMRERLGEWFPDDAIVGEELGEKSGASGFRWILDPIDGTKSFIGGVPLYSTLVGVERDGEPLIGVIYIPALDEGVYAARGSGAFHFQADSQPTPARVSRRSLADGIFVLSQVDSFAKRGARTAFDQLQSAAYVTRTWGDGYGYLLVATGRAELMVDPIMNVWDAAAILPVLIEAGGTFTDWRGRATIRGGEGIATNGVILEQVLAITSPFAPPS